MISIYLIIALVAAIALLVMAALGGFGGDIDADVDVDTGIDAGHFDAGHGDFSGSGISPLSIPIWLIFFTCFGSIGTIIEAAGYETLFIVGVSVTISMVITIVTFIILIVFFKN